MGKLTATVDLLQLLGEPSRVRLLALLAGHELTVADLCAITDLAQSRVSTHLGRLRDAGLLRDRRAGASTFYALNDGAMPEEARKLWSLVAAGLDDAVLEGDRTRCAALLRARESSGWPDRVAGEMERHYSPGRTWESLARGLLGLLRLGDVLDAGSGDGAVAELVAPRARTVTCLDRSPRMVAAARRRLAGRPNVACRLGDAAALPFRTAAFDQVLLYHVLTDAPQPARVLGEAARVLRPGGDLALLTLKRHDHLDVTSGYHHLHPGFAPAALRRLCAGAGLEVEQCEAVSRERRDPHFEVIAAFARKPGKKGKASP